MNALVVYKHTYSQKLYEYKNQILSHAQTYPTCSFFHKSLQLPNYLWKKMIKIKIMVIFGHELEYRL